MSLPEEHLFVKPELFDRKWVRLTLLVLVPSLIFVLVSAGIRVSQYGISHTILVYGDKNFERGGYAAIRVSLMSDDGRFFIPEHLTVTLIREEKKYLLFDDVLSDRGVAPGVEFAIPNLKIGPYILEIEVSFDKKKRIVRAPITILDRPPKENIETPPDNDLSYPHVIIEKDGKNIELFSEDRGIPTGIESAVFVRTTDKDFTPSAAKVSMILLGQKNEYVEAVTDASGLYAMSVRPSALDARIKFIGASYKKKISDTDSNTQSTDSDAALENSDSDKDTALDLEIKKPSAVLSKKIIYTGISASIAEPISPIGKPVIVEIEQISDGGPIFADLYRNGYLVHASSGWVSSSKASINVRPKQPGLYRLQVYTSAIAPGNATAVRHFYVSEKNETVADSLKKLLQRLIKANPEEKWAAAMLASEPDITKYSKDFDLQRTAAFVMSRLYKGHRHPHTLISSRKEDDAQLNAFKTKFQRMIMAAVLALGLAVSCFIGLFALSAYKRQKAINELIMSDNDTASSSDILNSKDPHRMVIQGIILFLIVVSAFVSIAVLVDSLTWIQK